LEAQSSSAEEKTMTQHQDTSHPLARLHGLLRDTLAEGERLRDALALIGFGSDEELGELFDDLTGLLFTVRTAHDLLCPQDYRGEVCEDLERALGKLEGLHAKGRGQGERVRVTWDEQPSQPGRGELAAAAKPAPGAEGLAHDPCDIPLTPAVRALVFGMRDTIATCAQLHAEHGEGCPCNGCHYASHVPFMIESLVGGIEGSIVGGGDLKQEWQQMKQLAFQASFDAGAAAEADPPAALVPAAAAPALPPLKRTWAWEQGS
jgi:hypothetical protein